jgi:hypothetical protein
MGRDNHSNIFAVSGYYFVGRHPIISAVGCNAGDCRLDLIQQRRHLRRISNIVPGQGRSHDHSGVGIHSQVQLFPSAIRLCAMLLLKPLTGSEDFQTRAVDQQVDRTIRYDTALVN